MEKPTKILAKTNASKSLLEAVNSLTSHDVQVTDTKMVLNYQQITQILPLDNTPLPPKFVGIQKLYLSNNFLQNLDGLEFFKCLTHLSLSFNEILDINELDHIKSRKTLELLSLDGNFLCKHPNYKFITVKRFPNLRQLDNLNITPYTKSVLKDSEQTELEIMPFLYNCMEEMKRLDSLHKILQLHQEAKITNTQLSSKLDPILFKNMLQQYSKVQENIENLDFGIKNNKPKGIRDIEKIINVMSDVIDTNIENLDLAKKPELQKIYQSLFREIIVGLKLQYNNRDIEKYLCYQIIKDDPKFIDLLKEEIPFNSLTSDSEFLQSCIDLIISTGSPKIDYEKFTEKMLSYFYQISPNTAKLTEPFIRSAEKIDFSGDESKSKNEINEQVLYRFPVFPLNEQYCEILGDTLKGIIIELLQKYSDIKLFIGQYFSFLISNFNTTKTDLQNEQNEMGSVESLELSHSDNEKEIAKNMPVQTNQDVEKQNDRKIIFHLGLEKFDAVCSKIVQKYQKNLVIHGLCQIIMKVKNEKIGLHKMCCIHANAYKRTILGILQILRKYAEKVTKIGRLIAHNKRVKIKTRILTEFKNLVSLKSIYNTRADIRRNMTLLSKFYKAARIILNRDNATKSLQIIKIAKQFEHKLLQKYFELFKIMTSSRRDIVSAENIQKSAKKNLKVTFDETINKQTAAETYANITNQDNTLMQVLEQKDSLIYQAPTITLEKSNSKIKNTEKLAKPKSIKKRASSKYFFEPIKFIKKSYTLYNKKKKRSVCTDNSECSYRRSTISFIAKIS